MYFLTRGSILCRSGKSASAGMTVQSAPFDSMSTDDGVGTAVSRSDSQTVESQGLVAGSSGFGDEVNEEDSGYDVPTQASLRSGSASVGSESTGGQDDEEVPMMMTRDETTARNSSPPPTYSQLFCTSTDAIPVTDATTCTHEQLHVTSDERQSEAGGSLPVPLSLCPSSFPLPHALLPLCLASGRTNDSSETAEKTPPDLQLNSSSYDIFFDDRRLTHMPSVSSADSLPMRQPVASAVDSHIPPVCPFTAGTSERFLPVRPLKE